MRKCLLTSVLAISLAVIVFSLTAPATYSQSAAPSSIKSKTATDITASQIQAVLKLDKSDKNADRLVKVVDAGPYNVTVSATDQSGNVSLAWIVIDVTSPPVTSGFAAFGGYVWSLFADVVEGIVEVAVVVVPIFVVVYLGVLPAYRRISKGRGSGQAERGTSKLP